MAAISTITISYANALLVEFDADIISAAEWAIAPTGEGQLAHGAEVLGVQQLSARVFAVVCTNLLPGLTYSLSVDAEDSGGAAVVSLELTVASDVVDEQDRPLADQTSWPAPHPYNMLQSLLFAFGKEMQAYKGKPQTMLTHDFEPTDTVMLVTSTVGFRQKCRVRLGGIDVDITSHLDTAFLGCDSAPRSRTIPKFTIVTSDTMSLPPDNDEYGPEAVLSDDVGLS